MLCAQTTSLSYPVLELLNNNKEDALEIYRATGFTMFPVIDKDSYAGIVSVDTIKALPKGTKLAEAQNDFIKVAVNEGDYFLAAFRLMALYPYNIVPVTTSENKYLGTITQQSLFRALGIFLDIKNADNSGLIVLQMDKINYSFSEIARLVESDNASIIQLNTYFDVQTNVFMVCIKINRVHISDIIATLQRFGYQIAYSAGEALYENELKRNYEALVNYLNI